jgi:transcriptional regulator with XRE-family HTH domain
MKSLGKNISQFRKLKGLTQHDLAERLNIHQSMVTRWEKDQVQPKSATLERLSEALEVPVEELLSAQEQGTRKTTIRGLSNPELADLLGQVHQLDPVDQEALRAVLDAMLTKRRIRDMVSVKISA